MLHFRGKTIFHRARQRWRTPVVEARWLCVPDGNIPEMVIGFFLRKCRGAGHFKCGLRA
jgi:hypothetical protein